MRQSTQALPEALAAALARFGQACRGGNVPRGLLAETMAEIGRLPPEAASWADAKIAYAGDLYGRYEQRPSRRPSLSARELLAHDRALAPLFTFHRDGYVREAALDRLADGVDSGFMLAALALRLNDWAKPVRIAALRCFERVLPRTTSSVIVQAAPFLLTRWRSWRRWESQNAAVVDRLFERADVAAALARLFLTGKAGPLGTMLRYALRGAALDGDLVGLAQTAKLPSVRVVALRTLIERRASWPVGFDYEWVDKIYGISRRITLYGGRPVRSDADAVGLIRIGLRDRFAAVRRVAADGLIERRASFPDIEDEMELLAKDTSAAVRDRAGFLARDRAKAGSAGAVA